MSAAPKPASASSIDWIAAGSRAKSRRAVMPTFFARTKVYGRGGILSGPADCAAYSNPSLLSADDVASNLADARFSASS
jgi:hypothetical protein